jgi:hypothetical protein
MRVIASSLTPAESHAVAVFYGSHPAVHPDN